MMLIFTIPGIPRLKQTVYRITKTHHELQIGPHDPFQEWRNEALPSLLDQIKPLSPRIDMWLPMDWALNCQAYFYRRQPVGVAALYYQALASLLKAANLIAHEKWIQSWDGSRLLVDHKNPHVKIVITSIDKEARRDL